MTGLPKRIGSEGTRGLRPRVGDRFLFLALVSVPTVSARPSAIRKRLPRISPDSSRDRGEG